MTATQNTDVHLGDEAGMDVSSKAGGQPLGTEAGGVVGTPSAPRSQVGLDAWAVAQPGRCAGCGFHSTQGCACEGQRLKFKGQAQTTAAHSADRQRVDSAIRQLAATGREFSSNDARPLHNVVGPVVGAAFTAAAKAGLIKRTGYEASTQPGTHAHPVATWKGIAA